MNHNCKFWYDKLMIVTLFTPSLFILSYGENSQAKVSLHEIKAHNIGLTSNQHKRFSNLGFDTYSFNTYVTFPTKELTSSTLLTPEPPLLLSQISNPVLLQNNQQVNPSQLLLPFATPHLSSDRNLVAEENPDIPSTIRVVEFEFEGNDNSFSSGELNTWLEEKGFIGIDITFDKLLEVENSILEKYTEGCQSREETSGRPCYINSSAYIPANDTAFSQNDAVIEVQIIEGSLEEEIEVNGTKDLNSEYISSRLQPFTKKAFDQNKLLEGLRLLQLDPLIQNISAELSAGSSEELSLLEVKVTEAPSFDLSLFFDNSRAPSVGSWRRGVQLTERNLLGFGDRFSGEFVNTEGSNAFDLSYSLPITAKDTRFNIAGGMTFTEVVEEPFDRAEIIGDSFNFEVGFNHPVYRSAPGDAVQELNLGLTATRQESNTEVLGENFSLSPGADANGETRISALRFSQEYSIKTLEDVFAVRSQFNVGLDIFDSTVNEDPIPDSRFFSWRGQGQYVRRLSRTSDSLMVVRSDLQIASSSLVPLEQFSVGGLQSVRGYRQDALLTDNGFFTSAELRFDTFGSSDSALGLFSIVPFFDLGVGWNNDSEDNPEENLLIGTGIGLLWEIQDKLNVRLDYGIPMTNIENSERTLQEDGVYFSVNSTIF